VAKKVGELLGWQVFDQDSLDYLIQTDHAREQLLAEVPPAARAWADAHFRRLQFGQNLAADPDTAAMVKLLLAVAARGDAVIVGRGAGFLLPPESTVHVRVVAPFERRVAYFAQELRLTREEAAEEVRGRDERRARFLLKTLGRNPTDPTGYDIVVNTDRVGIEGAAQFIGWAIRTKQLYAEIRAAEGSARPDDATGS
jgi:cytidylate kinase